MSEPVPQRSLGTSAALVNVAGHLGGSLTMGPRGVGHSRDMPVYPGLPQSLRESLRSTEARRDSRAQGRGPRQPTKTESALEGG